MRKLLLCSLILIGFSCSQEKEEPLSLESEEVLLFKQSESYTQTLTQGYDIDFNSAQISSNESGQKLLQLNIVSESNPNQDSYKYLFVIFNENKKISDSFIMEYTNEPVRNYTGKIALIDYKNLASGEIELKNGEVINTDLTPVVEKCRDTRHVMYCAAERIDNMNWLDKTGCYIVITECLAWEMGSCLVDGCPFDQ